MAVTVTVPEAPALMKEGKPDTTSKLAAAAATAIPDWLPVIDAVLWSVAVSVWLPAVRSEERRVGKECAPMGAREMHRARIGGGYVAVSIHGGNGQGSGSAGADRGGETRHEEQTGCRRSHHDSGLASGDRCRALVRRCQRLAPGRL